MWVVKIDQRYFLFIKLLELCNNDFEMFVCYMSLWYEDC